MPVHTQADLDDSHLASLRVIKEIAAKHGFTILGIDWGTMMIDMDGPPGNEMGLAQEIDEFLRRSKREEDKKIADKLERDAPFFQQPSKSQRDN